MKRITLTLDDATFHSADQKAKLAGMSLKSLVIHFLRQVTASGDSEFDRLEKQEETLRQRLRSRGAGFAAGDRLIRDELHERHALH
jgi:hypothetical protein